MYTRWGVYDFAIFTARRGSRSWEEFWGDIAEEEGNSVSRSPEHEPNGSQAPRL